MLEVLTGSGLAAAAGLNAYVPLLVFGLLARFTSLVDPPAAWAWIAQDWVLVLLAALLVVELVADKIPAVDTVNDVLQTAVRPASGGMVFSAGATSQTVRVDNPSTFLADAAWVPLVIGVAIALAVHLLKALVRPVVNAVTFGVGAPLVSTAEDAGSAALSLAAIAAPVLAAIGIVVLVVVLVRARRRFRERRVSEVTARPAFPSEGSDVD